MSDPTNDDDAARLRALQELVKATPGDADLALGLARLLEAGGRRDEALVVMGRALSASPHDERLIRFIADLGSARDAGSLSRGPAPAEPSDISTADASDGFSWEAAEADVKGVLPPEFIEIDDVPQVGESFGVVTLEDVAGLENVKERLTASFLAPLSNPELRRLYGKSLRGGLLLYGPPGCGKTFLARAVAGELGARFLSVSLTDILDPYIGVSERNVHLVFAEARTNAPCVLFLDEVDALGQRRSQTKNTAMRGVVNQLLTELDGVAAANEGVFVLAATNQPWDVDPALRRPGRLGRTLFVSPPDLEAREGLFRLNLRDRPVAGIDLAALAQRTEGFTGADIAGICESSAEQALLSSLRTGEVRLIGMGDLLQAIDEARPSSSAWTETARNLVTYGSDDGTFDDLRTYLKSERRR